MRRRSSPQRAFLFVLTLVLLAIGLWGTACAVSPTTATPPAPDGASAEDAAPPPSADARPRDSAAPVDAGAEPDSTPGAFHVLGATALSTTKLAVTFDAPPNAPEATDATHYSVPGLVLSAATVAGSTVTLTTSVQAAKSYALTVSDVPRRSDLASLDTGEATFDGRAPFAVVSAKSDDPVTLSITFDAAPTAAQAATLANYSVAGLVLKGTPILSGTTVKIGTSGQLAQTYTVQVAKVTRASDGEPLFASETTFPGTAAQLPTVKNVVVTSTSPNNGTTPYNTGTTTVTLTGTDLGSVDCVSAVKGVRLDDLDGVDAAVGTTAGTCTNVSNTQLSATFPAGIRTNGALGWNVIVTNAVGSNAASDVPFVPVAGLLISEVYTGTSGATDHEFVEVYNPTATAIDTKAAGLKLHVRSSSGADTNKTLTAVTNAVIPSHGFLLIVSSVSDAGDAWYANRDYTFAASLVGNGGVYLSLSATSNAKVLDKLGWGTQPAGGNEKSPTANIVSNFSVERKPAGGNGHASDSDDNASDFHAPNTVITPRGTADGAQP